MLTMIATGKKLDWGGWGLGIMGALISGGASALGSGVGSNVVDPEHFNVLQGGFHHMLALMGVSFIVSAIFSLGKYLQTHPVPELVDKSGAAAQLK
jgi:hypothetical protein